MEHSATSTSAGPSMSAKRLHSNKKSKNLKKKRIALQNTEVVTVPSIEEDSEDLVDSESVPDEDSDSAECADFLDVDSGEQLDFDIEAFPMEADDRDGIVDMLTQIFLRADIDLSALADALIAQSPFGIVIGPAEDQSDEDSENVVYGVLSVIELNFTKNDAPKFVTDVLAFLEKKSQKFAVKKFRDVFETLKSQRTGLFVNERMLNFPTRIVSPSFESIRSDYAQLKQPYQSIVYIHKLRIADSETLITKTADRPVRKKKTGKSEKKRMAQRALLSAEVIYDNAEDQILTQLDEGEACFFDYPVHSEVESSSKFHTIVKDGKAYRPYRRVVVMDGKRFKAFLEQVNSSF